MLGIWRGSICYSAGNIWVSHCIYPLCVFVFEAERRIDRRFPPDCLFIQALILSVCFLKLFVYMCQVSCSNTLLFVLTVHGEGCLRAPRQAVPQAPPQPHALFWYNTSGSYPDPLLQRHGWGWGLICLDWEPLPQEGFQSVKSPWMTRCSAEAQCDVGWSFFSLRGKTFCYPLHWCLCLTCWFVGCCLFLFFSWMVGFIC